MTISANSIYPRTNDRETVYLKNAISNPAITVGDYTIYNDFVRDPRGFEKNNVLYQYPINRDRLVIGRFCSIACGARFLFNSANHTLRSLSSYPFPIFFEEWGLDIKEVAQAWDNKGDIVVGNDVWIGFEAVVMAGVTVGDRAPFGAGSGMPCGACREFLMQLSERNRDTEIMADYAARSTVTLGELLPNWWGEERYRARGGEWAAVETE